MVATVASARFLITMSGEFLCRGAHCGLGIPRGRIATTPAEIQAAFHKKGVIAAGDMFPEACLEVRRGQQRRVPACSVPSCRSIRAAPCQHFQCNGWWCDKHCHKMQLMAAL
eukprot:193494-Amphidinium_carterae.1